MTGKGESMSVSRDFSKRNLNSGPKVTVKISRIEDCNLAKNLPERLLKIREVLRLSREALLGEYGIPKTSLLSWEHGIKNISDDYLRRLLAVYAQEGLLVDIHWVKTGQGTGPQWIRGEENAVEIIAPVIDKKFKKNLKEDPAIRMTDDLLLSQEVVFFKHLGANSIALMVESDDMQPYFSRGDWVGGRFRTGDELEKIINLPCIVRLENGQEFIRILSPVLRKNMKNNKSSKNKDSKNLFHLSCTNPAAVSKNKPAVIPNAVVKMAAPIVWIRKKESNF